MISSSSSFCSFSLFFLAYSSGISINNSRVCEQRIEYSNDVAINRSIQAFLEYVKVAIVYPMKSAQCY